MEESGSGCRLNGLLNLEVHELSSSAGEVGSGTSEMHLSLDKVNAESSVVQRKIEIEAKGFVGSSVQGELFFYEPVLRLSLVTPSNQLVTSDTAFLMSSVTVVVELD